MNVGAIIVEQLEEDGALRTLRMLAQKGRPLTIALGNEYDEPREGPFHFLDGEYEVAFGEMLQRKARRVSKDRFKQNGDIFEFTTSWRGIPTGRDELTYYALCLPKFALPQTVVASDPHIADKEYRRSVYRDDRRNRFVIYLECRSSRGVFDFSLRTTFVIERSKFLDWQYADSFSDSELKNHNAYLHFVNRAGEEQLRTFFD